MQAIFKYFYLVTFIITFGIAGCQNDSSKNASTEDPDIQMKQQSPQFGQAQQQAPDVDVSDEEADKFVTASMDLQKVQMGAQQKMMKIIKNQGLDIETFQKIARKERGGQAAMGNNASRKSDANSDITEEDKKKYEQANKAIKKKQADIEKKMTAAIEDAGMEKERYQKISKAARQDSVLQNRLREKMMQKQGGQGGMQAPTRQDQ